MNAIGSGDKISKNSGIRINNGANSGICAAKEPDALTTIGFRPTL